MSRFQFEIATPADEAELRGFSRGVVMPGAINLSFNRDPDYFASLRVEGRHTEVLVCRNVQTRRVAATGHRSIKPMFINGIATPVGCLSGLRLDASVRGGQILARGYNFLRERHSDGRTRFYLTTLMEDNHLAKTALLSKRCGLPDHHDLGRFCCMAVSLRHARNNSSKKGIHVRKASAADGPAIVAFLQREGCSRQFFPEYQISDFGCSDGLLPRLAWDNIFLALWNGELTGVVAAWDQRGFRQWQVTGYKLWLSLLRAPANLIAGLTGFPRLPAPGAPLDYFILSLVCIQNSDREVFTALLDEVIHQSKSRYAFFLAGLHERDPLLPGLAARHHFPLPSRLFAVAWEDGAEMVRGLDRKLIPYLELGAL